MRKSSLLLLVALSVLLVGLGLIMLLQDTSLLPPAALATPLRDGEVPRISVDQLHARLQGANPPLVWELRIPESYARQHIPGSQRVDMEQVASLAGGLSRQQPIVILCA